MAATRTQPNGRVLGVDIIPAQPPKGVSTIQGNFLDPEIQAYVQEFLRDPQRGRPRALGQFPAAMHHNQVLISTTINNSLLGERSEADLRIDSQNDHASGRTVDVVLSDMSAPWYQTTGFWKRSLSDPYNRMMNTSGMSFRDHAGSMVNNSRHQNLYHLS